MAENEGLDAAAADLREAADEVLSTTGDEEEESGSKTGGKRAALRQAAKIVQDTANKGIDDSKAYISTVIEKVEAYAQGASDAAGVHLTEVKGNLAKAVQAGSSSSATTTDRGLETESDEPLKFPYNIVTWCTSICGMAKETAKTAKGTSIESLKTAAEHVSTTLREGAQSVRTTTGQENQAEQ